MRKLLSCPQGKWQPNAFKLLAGGASTRQLRRHQMRAVGTLPPRAKTHNAPPPHVRSSPMHPWAFMAEVGVHMARRWHRHYKPGPRGKVWVCIWFLWFYCVPGMLQVSTAARAEATTVNPSPPSELRLLSRGAATLPVVPASSPCNYGPPFNRLLTPLSGSHSFKRPPSAPWLSGSLRPLPALLPFPPTLQCRRNASEPVAGALGPEAGEAEPQSLAPQIPYLMMPTVPEDAEVDAVGLLRPGHASIAPTHPLAFASLFSWKQIHFMSQSRLRNVEMKLQVLLLKSSLPLCQPCLRTSLLRCQLLNLRLLYQTRPRLQTLQGRREQA